ncbi:hypothetical protein BDY21DRAFT_182908 [Lineolata rhizophorae]|uniref:BHLH domain-containing protein n=1 Tax=Lineolata rhizophorae TaxID=578093 RepID=A0A6A6P8A7_9PEZI|nr:hypothetical protein BDY21DRAFT_182908 [Lineolata rhizophorae]
MDPSASPTDRRQQQALPSIASLTGPIIPQQHPPVDQFNLQSRPLSDAARDSGNWSLTQSKHSSGVSNTTGLQLQTILNHEDSPSKSSVPGTPQSARGPAPVPTPLPTLNQGLEHPHNRMSSEVGSQLESRRSSVDSRVNVGMGHLAISPSSPYDSQNVSRASLVSSLQAQRGITTDQRPNGPAPMSPLGARSGPHPHRPPPGGRQAPVINPNPRSVSGMPDPMAAAPTKGYAWAFPDQADIDDPRGSTSDDSMDHRSGPSRQNSFATSVNSSIYNADSGLPVGQKRFEDAHTHHHSMQHKVVSSLQSSESAANPSGGNYSRTPELRISHKMAERKRRSEMKQLFDELNGILPNSPGSKSSKWEILTKAIEYIKTLSRNHDICRHENNVLRNELESVRGRSDECEVLRGEVSSMWHALKRIDPGNNHVYGNTTNALAQQYQSQQVQAQAHVPVQAQHGQAQPSGTGTILPPLQSGSGSGQLQQAHWGPQPHAAQPTAMQGVEFASGRPYDPR